MTNGEVRQGFRRIAVVGNYVPRRCGIATFTTDLCEALAGQCPESPIYAVPVNDTEEGYDYPDRVRFELAQNDPASYRRAADFLNICGVDVVGLQHEFGIFGGPAGEHVLALLEDLRMPVTATMHTIVDDPSPEMRRVLDEICRRTDRLVVMSRRGAQFLADVYGVSADRIDLIPHGIPDLPFLDPNYFKDRFGVAGRPVLLTFGLLSPNKGIAGMISAMPAILAAHPDVVYIVLGATHPHVRRREGESHRLSLQALAEDLGVADHIMFYNRFVSSEELQEFIGAADIYVTPYLNRAQITSGTLAYAVGAGKAVVSTPYWFAEEMLADGRGVLVPFGDPQAMAQAIVDLLDNDAERHAMRKRAYLFGREMVWSNVARLHLTSFERARADHHRRARPVVAARTLGRGPKELPPLQLHHLRRLTDDTGVLQHATFVAPNYAHGYATDDNARALLLSVLLEQEAGGDDGATTELGVRCMSFLHYAFDEETQRFRNFLGYDRRWVDEVASEDCHGRALHALGAVLARSTNDGLRGPAGRLFELGLGAASALTSPRGWAFSLLGIAEYLGRFGGDRAARQAGEALAARLLDLHRAHAGDGWLWFEPELTYANATLPHALLASADWMGDDGMRRSALAALEWLTSQQRAAAGHFAPIGTNGWFPRGGERARFDQQPIEAHATVAACLAAWRATGDDKWRREAERAFDWFLGRNDLKTPLYDPVTGGCRDGLHVERANQNMGAESTLCFLMSLLELRLADAHRVATPAYDRLPV